MAAARLVPTVPVLQDVELTLTHAEACEIRRLIAGRKDTTEGNAIRSVLDGIGITYYVATGRSWH